MKKKKVFTDPRTALELENAYKEEASWFKPADGVLSVSREMDRMGRVPTKV